MKHQLFWIFGIPEESSGELSVDFYYQAGKHTRLTIPVPAPRFQAAGELPFQLSHENNTTGPSFHLPSNPVEAGKTLFQILGEDAQKTLIRSFANLDNHIEERILYLIFSTPQAEANEWSLTLEDLPWEYLHDGKDFISNQFQLQIVRNHTKEQFPLNISQHDVDFWRIILVNPFVFSNQQTLEKAGLPQLPGAQEEIRAIHKLAQQTNGFIEITPNLSQSEPIGITQLQALETLIKNSQSKPNHIIHFCGHGVIYEEEPCLCFESANGGIDYVSVDQLKQMFIRTQTGDTPNTLPSILFLNACSSSSRGKYSAGFAAGLHSLDLCVLGYQTHVHDDEKLTQASTEFYRSLCLEQPLNQAYSPSTVVKAVAKSRKHLDTQSTNHTNHACNLQVYLPAQLEYRWIGRGLLERGMQSVYSRFAEWMNPSDYTSHLSLVFFTALVFGTLFGIENLLFVFPESVLTNYLSYTEIVSELIRIFMVGPLSFLATAVWIAWLTISQYRIFTAENHDSLWVKLGKFLIHFIPISILAAGSYSLMFSYSFSHLDLLTAKTIKLSTISNLTTAQFWYGLSGFLGIVMLMSLAFATWLSYRKRETLHYYQLYTVLIMFYLCGGIINILFMYQPFISDEFLIVDWFCCTIINIAAFALVTTKLVKETGWRSVHQVSNGLNMTWRKLLPLFGGAVIILLCYILLEESVRFERETIQWALEERTKNAGNPQSEYVERVLERALRQRAIDNVPERVRQVADKDWLLSLIFADHLLFLSQDTYVHNVQQVLTESEDYLFRSQDLKPAVQYTDYFDNIQAMVLLNKIRFTEIEIDENDESEEGDIVEKDLGEFEKEQEERKEKIALCNTALRNAFHAVQKDKDNLAYLDTLANAEYQLAVLTYDEYRLKSALKNCKRAEWFSFFLRSSRSEAIQNSIKNLRLKIENKLAEWNG